MNIPFRLSDERRENPRFGRPLWSTDSEIVIDCERPKTLAEFWCSVLGYRVLEEQDDAIEIGPPDVSTDDDWAEWRARLRREAAPPTIVFVVVPEAKATKNRLHIDLSPIDTSPAEIKLSSAASDIVEASERAMLEALCGWATPEALGRWATTSRGTSG